MMITCDYCKAIVTHDDHRMHPDGRDLHAPCFDRVMKLSTVNWLIMDYVAICEKRNELLSFSEFVALWTAANDIATEQVRNSRPEDDPPPPLPFASRSRG